MQGRQVLAEGSGDGAPHCNVVIWALGGVRGAILCTTERPQFFKFEVANCRTCRLRSKKAILEVATSNLQK